MELFTPVQSKYLPVVNPQIDYVKMIMMGHRYLLIFLFLFSFYAWPSSMLIPCPKCACAESMIPLRENFLTPGPPIANRPHLSCFEVKANLVNPATCLLQNNITPNIVSSCQGSVIRSKCPELGASIPYTYQVGEVTPANCGYAWKGFGYERYFKTVEKFKEKGEVECLKSMCTSATFLVWVSVVKRLHELGKVTDEEYEEMTKPGSKAYRIINNNAEPNQLVEAFSVGKGSIQYVSEGKVGKGGVPKPGDFVQLWRSSGSGHSVIFKGFIDSDKDGTPDLICYWSSQPPTGGYANNCESIKKIDRLLIGSLDV